MTQAVPRSAHANDNTLGRATLPGWLQPRGLRRDHAAAYISVSATMFDTMVKDGRMPRPRLANACTIWDRHELDLAFDALPSQGGRSDYVIDTWEAAFNAAI